MNEQAIGSNLRLSAVKSNSRLLKGYGPLAVLLVAFVLMAMLVPTKAPQQEVVHETQAASTSGAGGAAGGAGATGPGPTVAQPAEQRVGGGRCGWWCGRRGLDGGREDGVGGRCGHRQDRLVPGPDRAGVR